MRRTYGIRGRAVAAPAVTVAVVAAALLSGCKVQATGPGISTGTDTDGKPPGRSQSPAPGHEQKQQRKQEQEQPTAPEIPAAPLVLRPGEQGLKVRELQARLRQIGWLFRYPTGTYDRATAEAVDGFQGKRGLPRTGRTDTVTWQRLLGMTRKPGHFELYAAGDQPRAKPDARCRTGRVLCISKQSRTLSWLIDGRVVSTVDVRFGSQYTPTREGTFRVYWKSRHHVSTLYDTPMPYAMFFSGGQAVHYSADFAARGYTGTSHGCVNVRDEKKIAALYAQVRKGDKVVVYW
ncbi:L,D-transpeptidase family protein [Streptomyces boluensis]|uniref:L,D-transpeptidase family protein n=1 Tax=Streptomyces boluensis TaxID=1775135 RepID=A0A964XK08_9ACTN|nr:L,D-transpeptidase family protein [Streptomyces boluensis]NBE51715.1 L,D-transpeptidase family protein [Streptomyces boluensis]